MATGQMQLRLNKLTIYKKRVVTNTTLSIWYFHFANFDMNFVENSMKKPFLGQMLFLR